jgi:rhodanese-related sulfurtransferase
MTTPIKLLATLLATGALLVAGCSGSATNAGVQETVSPADAAEVIASDHEVVVLDIRTPEEYSAGIIDGAVNIDFYAADFSDQLDALDKDAHYVLYCRSGNRSGQAMETFADLGFAEVTEIDGGIVNWYGSGLPVVAP